MTMNRLPLQSLVIACEGFRRKNLRLAAMRSENMDGPDKQEYYVLK